MAPKRKRGRPSTGRKGKKVHVLPETHRKLTEMARADGRRLGQWLDEKVGSGLVSTIHRARLLEAIRTAVSLMYQMDDLLTESPPLLRDEVVLEQLGELAITFSTVKGWLKEAGFGDRLN